MVGAFVINLDRSRDRWAAIASQAERVGMRIDRIAGIDGGKIASGQRSAFNERRFICRNGRPILPGEYGCYLAHIKALETFLESGYDSAIIMEDDVELVENLTSRASAILAAVPSADLVKLLNHRSRFFRGVAVTPYGDAVGRCLHGPQGSAACYLVTRHGARKLLSRIQQIEFPYDVTLERGWKTGLNIFTVRENVVSLSERALSSQIASRAEYRAVKKRGIKKMRTHLVRIFEYARRIQYALS
ncbi:glycosyltransferase family 25 protein [Rhizobium sp. Root1220]|uniref:glycosyltransferase family 25 protein n=1 Tax=Rhizobium sp. Root1220 TaxID=1736432 RepID=UPI001FCDE647|nr:glycosyltransferase family 25 protein [Rhizobium sp. Root1220]